jgi:predicted nucleic-acid-binding protein
VIGLDTNVLVRYLTQDDATQAARASAVIEKANPASLFIASVVVCEVVWVLEDAYGHKRDDIAEVLEKLLLSAQLTFENKDELWQTLADYRQGKGDFSDYLIGRTAHRAGCVHTLTFDTALKASKLFHLL